MMDIYYPPTHPQYRRNTERISGNDIPCFICGKATKRTTYMVRTLGGNAICSDAVAEANPAADSGFYPIGSDCYRNLPVDVRALARKEGR